MVDSFLGVSLMYLKPKRNLKFKHFKLYFQIVCEKLAKVSISSINLNFIVHSIKFSNGVIILQGFKHLLCVLFVG